MGLLRRGPESCRWLLLMLAVVSFVSLFCETPTFAAKKEIDDTGGSKISLQLHALEKVNKFKWNRYLTPITLPTNSNSTMVSIAKLFYQTRLVTKKTVR